MAYIGGYSHITLGTIPAEVKDEAWLSFSSWVGYLQSFPGLLDIRMAARDLENGDIRYMIEVTWQYAEQLEEWSQSKWSAANILQAFRKPGYDIVSEGFAFLS